MLRHTAALWTRRQRSLVLQHLRPHQCVAPSSSSICQVGSLQQGIGPTKPSGSDPTEVEGPYSGPNEQQDAAAARASPSFSFQHLPSAEPLHEHPFAGGMAGQHGGGSSTSQPEWGAEPMDTTGPGGLGVLQVCADTSSSEHSGSPGAIPAAEEAIRQGPTLLQDSNNGSMTAAGGHKQRTAAGRRLSSRIQQEQVAPLSVWQLPLQQAASATRTSGPSRVVLDAVKQPLMNTLKAPKRAPVSAGTGSMRQYSSSSSSSFLSVPPKPAAAPWIPPLPAAQPAAQAPQHGEQRITILRDSNGNAIGCEHIVGHVQQQQHEQQQQLGLFRSAQRFLSGWAWGA